MRSLYTAMAAIALTVPALRAAPDYFPLEVGNVWVYRGTGTLAVRPLTLEITKAGEFHGLSYVLLHGFAGEDHWIREDEHGTVFAYDPDHDQETVWYAFQSPEGEVYQTSLPGTCCGKAAVFSRPDTYKGPIGEFDNALEIHYPGVFQVGIEKEVFLPGVGMVHRAQATGGPSFGTYDLIYARIAGRVVSGPELSFGLHLDQSVYIPVGPGPRQTPLVITARITLRNTSTPIKLSSLSSQIYDLTISDENGQIVYQWSADKIFVQVVQTHTFGPGEVHYVVVTPPLTDQQGRGLPAGKYVAKAWLTTETPPGERRFSASVEFEVRWLKVGAWLRHTGCCYWTASVTSGWLSLLPIVSTTGTAGPAVTSSGIRAFTCNTPATRVGAAPA